MKKYEIVKDNFKEVNGVKENKKGRSWWIYRIRKKFVARRKLLDC